MIANKFAGLVVRALVLCGFSLAAALSFVAAAFGQTAPVNVHQGERGQNNSYQQSNPASANSKGGCDQATAGTSNDSAPVQQNIQQTVTPNVTPVDPATLVQTPVQATGVCELDIQNEQQLQVQTDLTSEQQQQLDSQQLQSTDAGHNGNGSGNNGENGNNNGAKVKITEEGDEGDVTLPSLTTVQPGNPAPAGNWTVQITTGDVGSTISAPGATSRGRAIGGNFTQGSSLTSGAFTVGETGRTQGLSSAEGLGMIRTGVRFQRQQLRAVRNATLEQMFRPTADGPEINVHQDQNQDQSQTGGGSSAQRSRQN